MTQIPAHIHGNTREFKFLNQDKVSEEENVPDYFYFVFPDEDGEDQKAGLGVSILEESRHIYAVNQDLIKKNLRYILNNLQLKYTALTYTLLVESKDLSKVFGCRTKVGINGVIIDKSNFKGISTGVSIRYPNFYGAIRNKNNIDLNARLEIRLPDGSDSIFDVKHEDDSLELLISRINNNFNNQDYTNISEKFSKADSKLIKKNQEKIKASFSKKAIFYLHNYDNWDIIIKETNELLKRGDPIAEFMMVLNKISILNSETDMLRAKLKELK